MIQLGGSHTVVLWEVTTYIVMSSIGLRLKVIWSVHLVTTRVVMKSSVSENKPCIFFRTPGHDTRRREVFLGDFLTSKFDWKWNLVHIASHDTSCREEWKWGFNPFLR